MNEALNAAAAMLQTTADDLARFPENVQAAMADAASRQAFDELNELWQTGYLDEEMLEVSRVSGVSMQTLSGLPNDAKVQLAYLLAQKPDDSVSLNRCITDYLSVAAIPDIAALLKKPVQELRALPISRQKELCGAFDMLYDTIPASELAAELTGILNGEAS